MADEKVPLSEQVPLSEKIDAAHVELNVSKTGELVAVAQRVPTVWITEQDFFTLQEGPGDYSASIWGWGGIGIAAAIGWGTVLATAGWGFHDSAWASFFMLILVLLTGAGALGVIRACLDRRRPERRSFTLCCERIKAYLEKAGRPPA